MFINQNKLSLMMLSMHSDRNLFRPKVQGMDILGYWKSQELFQRVYCKKHLQKRASIIKHVHTTDKSSVLLTQCVCAQEWWERIRNLIIQCLSYFSSWLCQLFALDSLSDWLDAPKRIVRENYPFQENAFEQQKKKLGLKFNSQG